MLSNHTVQELILTLPTMKHCAPGSVYLTHCLFHGGETASMVVDFERDSVVCLSCGFGGTTDRLKEELERREGRKPNPAETKNNIFLNLPWDNYGHLVSEEVSQTIHSHLFSSKVRELNTAVEQLAQLISRMKLWIDPEK